MELEQPTNVTTVRIAVHRRVLVVFSRLVSEGAGRVLLHPGAITLWTATGQREISSDELKSALLIQRDAQRVVELVTLRGDRVEVAVESDADGERVLDALGFLRGQRAMSVKSVGLASRARFALAGVGCGLFMATLFVSPGIPLVVNAVAGLALGFLSALSALYMLSTRGVSLGGDGVTLQWGGHFFMAFTEIESVSVEPREVWINLRGGGRKGLSGWIDDPAVRLSVARRIVLGLNSAPHATNRGKLLEPQGRSLAEWKAALKEMSSSGAYRGTELERSELHAVLGCAEAPMEQRLGAAIALATTSDEQSRELIRVVAEGCANPPVREAFVRVAADELEQQHLDEAMYELERAARSAK